MFKATNRPHLRLGLLGGTLLACTLCPWAINPVQPAPQSPLEGQEWSWWVGHQITRGHRKVPVLGKLATHLETYYIAKVRKKGAGFEVIQSACASSYRPIAGVKIGFHAEHTPPIRYDFMPGKQGALQAKAQVVWAQEDLDEDGQPGLSIDVNARICRGKLYVGNHTQIESKARWVNPWQWEGTIQTQHLMNILGSDSFCLRTFARSRKEKSQGSFRFKALSGPTTCKALLKRPWLVHAESSDPAPSKGK